MKTWTLKNQKMNPKENEREWTFMKTNKWTLKSQKMNPDENEL